MSTEVSIGCVRPQNTPTCFQTFPLSRRRLFSTEHPVLFLASPWMTHVHRDGDKAVSVQHLQQDLLLDTFLCCSRPTLSLVVFYIERLPSSGLNRVVQDPTWMRKQFSYRNNFSWSSVPPEVHERYELHISSLSYLSYPLLSSYILSYPLISCPLLFRWWSFNLSWGPEAEKDQTASSGSTFWFWSGSHLLHPLQKTVLPGTDCAQRSPNETNP